MSTYPTFAPWPMEFTLQNIDLAGGLGSPLIAAALALCAFALAAWFLFILHSKRSPRDKALRLIVLLALSPWVGRVTEELMKGAIVWFLARDAPDTGFGFIGQAPRAFVPLLALALIAAAQSLRFLTRAVLALRAR